MERMPRDDCRPYYYLGYDDGLSGYFRLNTMEVAYNNGARLDWSGA